MFTNLHIDGSFFLQTAYYYSQFRGQYPKNIRNRKIKAKSSFDVQPRAWPWRLGTLQKDDRANHSWSLSLGSICVTVGWASEMNEKMAGPIILGRRRFAQFLAMHPEWDMPFSCPSEMKRKWARPIIFDHLTWFQNPEWDEPFSAATRRLAGPIILGHQGVGPSGISHFPAHRKWHQDMRIILKLRSMPQITPHARNPDQNINRRKKDYIHTYKVDHPLTLFLIILLSSLILFNVHGCEEINGAEFIKYILKLY